MNEKLTHLSATSQIRVRFNETDAMNVVWHGNYIRYFEDARDAFADKYGIDYHTVKEQGFLLPIVDMHCSYKRSLTFGDHIEATCTLAISNAAKVIFYYELRNARTQEIVATGKTIQVFLNLKGQLQLYIPAFFEEWKAKYIQD